MNENEWAELLPTLARDFPIKGRGPVAEDILVKVELSIGMLPSDLRSLYRVTNGLRYEWFNILPVERKLDTKETWDGLLRANDTKKTKFLGRSEKLLSRFLVFAEIGGGHCGCIERANSSIWFQDEEGLHQTDLSLTEFVKTTIRDVAEL